MSNEIIIAIIGGICVAVPTIITTLVTNNKSTAVMQYKIDSLEKKVDKHNEVVTRTYILEEKMSVANHRISDLEKKEEN